MKLLIDTNIILDMVLKRNDYEIFMELFRRSKETRTGVYITASSVTEQDIREAFVQKWKDFEDCVQYITGRNNRMDYIVTVNQKDYEDAQLPVMTLVAWIAMIGRI